MLADMATQIEAARALYLAAARRRDAGEPFGTQAAMAKLFGTDMAMRVTTDAVQVLGGYGYVQDYPVERYMREAKVLQIVEGTNQIQRMVIARHLTRGDGSRPSADACAPQTCAACHSASRRPRGAGPTVSPWRTSTARSSACWPRRPDELHRPRQGHRPVHVRGAPAGPPAGAARRDQRATPRGSTPRRSACR